MATGRQHKNFWSGIYHLLNARTLQRDLDVKHFEEYMHDSPGLALAGSTVLSYVDYGPGAVSGLHHTMSIDYSIVVEGESELILDCGESRLMKIGDTSIVRTTKYGRRNPSQSAWCRMVFVLLDAKPPFINGKEIEEDYGTAIPGVKSFA